MPIPLVYSPNTIISDFAIRKSRKGEDTAETVLTFFRVRYVIGTRRQDLLRRTNYSEAGSPFPLG